MKRLILIFGMICVLGAAPVFAQEAEAEEEEKEPKWVGSLGLAWVATSGNTDTSSIGLDFGLESKPAPWGFSFAARGNRAEDQGVQTAENYLVTARAVRKLAKRWDVYGGLAWAKDPFAGFDSQSVASAGAIYTAVESERHFCPSTWASPTPGRIGCHPTRTWTLPAVSSVSPGSGNSVRTRSSTERLVYLPNFDNSADWRLNSIDRHRSGHQRVAGPPIRLRHPPPQPADR